MWKGRLAMNDTRKDQQQGQGQGQGKQGGTEGSSQQQRLDQSGHAGMGGGHAGQQSGGMGGMHGGDLHDVGSAQSGMTGGSGMGGNDTVRQESGSGSQQAAQQDALQAGVSDQSAQREGMGQHRHPRPSERDEDATIDQDDVGSHRSSAADARRP
jgi:hypothetical protein